MATKLSRPIMRKSHNWLIPSLVTSSLVAFSIVASLLILGIVAMLYLIRLAIVFIAMGMLSIAAVGASATTNALYSGDSATRLAVLTQFKQTFDAQPQQTFDRATADWILPALKQCQSDEDPKVALLADELIDYVNIHVAPSDATSNGEASL